MADEVTIEEDARSQTTVTEAEGKRKRAIRAFPALSYEESLIIANGIWQYASGQKIRRITLFDQIGKAPESGPSRTLVTSSAKYGITLGGYQADYIELTPDGSVATNPEEELSRRAEANFKLAIGSNTYLSGLYNQFKNMKVPANSVLADSLKEQGLEEEECKKGVELFIINAKFIGLIKVLAGSERIITIEQVIEDINSATPQVVEKAILPAIIPTIESNYGNSLPAETVNAQHDKWEKMCFYITPIGEEGSEQRKHSDLFLSSIVEPALNEFDLSVVRADNISAPGMITSQIIEHIINAKLVIADLSYHNPNVFYELSLRHTFNLPTIHLIRKCDNIPFDLNNFRTITIDTSSIYTLVPQLDTYKTSIARQVRQLLENPEALDNPISAYMAKAKITINTIHK
ncbi:hypothetical protein EQM14_10905 [Caproiciproducens sp. NJN-50]|uniref:hypothetical protein n=1 Tax=Acutalibacteraceae TaxID=3082771 RepID=UPI000FFE1762|nr:MULTISPECIES: hypothetical protein [Acutalibacteraceae]QAT50233.1 hypothetical protein EQM14_10905 [Caproiciproducens sp. NJN-50]